MCITAHEHDVMATAHTHFETNRDAYDTIHDRLATTFENFVDAPRDAQKTALCRATTFALVSVQTPLHIHEDGYLAVLDHPTADGETLGEVLSDAGVNYCYNKGRYIEHNRFESDLDQVVDHIEAGEHRQALRAVVDECKGVGINKSAFALALLGVPEMACVDTHTAQKAGIEYEDVYTGVVPDKYMEQWERIESKFGTLSEQTPTRFVFQWVLFGSNLGEIVMHDPFYLSLPESVAPSAV